MDTLTHPSESTTPELSPELSAEQLSELNGGYEYGEAEYVPQTSDSEAPKLNQAAADLLNTNSTIRQKFTRILATAGGAAALTFLLAACGPTGEATPPPTTAPTSEPSTTPTPTETETPTSSEAYNYNIDKATVDTLVAGGQDAFLAQPIESRIDVALYYAQEELVEFADIYQKVSKDPNGTLPASMSAESSAEDVRTFLYHMQNLVYTQAMPDNYHIDTVTAKAILGGSVLNVPQSSVYANGVAYIDAFAAQQATPDAKSVDSARSLASSDRRSPIIVGGTVVFGEDSENRPFYTFDVVSPEGDGTPVTVTARWIVAKSGNGMWVQD